MKELIEAIIESLQHPFFMLVGGLVFWFTFIWSVGRDERRKKLMGFWDDQGDEVLVALVGGLVFLIWDDETLYAISYVKDVWIGSTSSEEWQPQWHELPTFMYLLVGPGIERLYWLYKLGKAKFTSK